MDSTRLKKGTSRHRKNGEQKYMGFIYIYIYIYIYMSLPHIRLVYDLVYLFNGISTFVGYLMPKPLS